MNPDDEAEEKLEREIEAKLSGRMFCDRLTRIICDKDTDAIEVCYSEVDGDGKIIYQVDDHHDDTEYNAYVDLTAGVIRKGSESGTFQCADLVYAMREVLSPSALAYLDGLSPPDDDRLHQHAAASLVPVATATPVPIAAATPVPAAATIPVPTTAATPVPTVAYVPVLTTEMKKAKKALIEYETMHIHGQEINVAQHARRNWKLMDETKFAEWCAELLAMYNQVLQFADGAFTRGEHVGVSTARESHNQSKKRRV